MDTWKNISNGGAPQDGRPSGGESRSERNEARNASAPRPEASPTDDQRREAARRDEAQKPKPAERQETLAGTAPRAGVPDPDEDWKQILAAFVDDPRTAVSRAHELVGRSVQAMIDAWNAERTSVEQKWAQVDHSDTETLRVCLQQYRAMFQRLASGIPSKR